ncbi:hypothetical protein E1293_20570 [Actinomadura darangshiensis]|uniref:Uncharacterized protein n=1 Tax=Actinomadura darangshiensis TaxID=705336 RepID=A0A4R5B6L1_9ACTN|nr:hypothetical protein [Actinomadura darangshiensis]TDD80509.1 hypothetical protein E1293_20570 [Actinomadura darangshiensis]
MGGVRVDPHGIKMHGQMVEDRVVTLLDAAKKKLGEDGVANLEGGDFSITLFGAAMGYPIAAQFAFEDVSAQKKEADEMAKKLGETALTWHQAEQSNTAK